MKWTIGRMIWIPDPEKPGHGTADALWGIERFGYQLTPSFIRGKEMEPFRNEEGLYVLTIPDSPFLKVGYSQNLPNRLEQWRIALPAVRLEYLILGPGYRFEAAVHRYLRAFLNQPEASEWFNVAQKPGIITDWLAWVMLQLKGANDPWPLDLAVS